MTRIATIYGRLVRGAEPDRIDPHTSFSCLFRGDQRRRSGVARSVRKQDNDMRYILPCAGLRLLSGLRRRGEWNIVLAWRDQIIYFGDCIQGCENCTADRGGV